MVDSQTLKERLRTFATKAGVDSLGVASVEAYTAIVPNGQIPAHSSASMRSIVVFTKHNLSGSMALHDVSTQSYNSHLALDAVIDLTSRLAEWLEAEGHLALPLHPEFNDEDLQRSGAGLLDFKHVAEFAGLGHIGLNLNFLTPAHGSRVYLGVLLTSAEMTADSRGPDLCPGMKCGRCAVVCPTQAIPLMADRGAHVDAYRDLHQEKCSEGATRLSIRTLFRVLRLVLARREQLPPEKVFADKYWRDFWIALNSKRGAIAACFECMYVCPIGNEDARAIFAVPYRCHDIHGGKVTHIRSESTHAVEHVGPPPDRVHEYSRHLVFANQSADESQS